eukprot:GEMP01019452.1.p1 GENE.GEMP01019452.1~~GEMP01019452.1.p1  ORF type:complete len:757 (-),score=178.39 GEMP01019452.1:418-2643(-)
MGCGSGAHPCPPTRYVSGIAPAATMPGPRPSSPLGGGASEGKSAFDDDSVCVRGDGGITDAIDGEPPPENRGKLDHASGMILDADVHAEQPQKSPKSAAATPSEQSTPSERCGGGTMDTEDSRHEVVNPHAVPSGFPGLDKLDKAVLPYPRPQPLKGSWGGRDVFYDRSTSHSAASDSCPTSVFPSKPSSAADTTTQNSRQHSESARSSASTSPAEWCSPASEPLGARGGAVRELHMPIELRDDVVRDARRKEDVAVPPGMPSLPNVVVVPEEEKVERDGGGLLDGTDESWKDLCPSDPEGNTLTSWDTNGGTWSTLLTNGVNFDPLPVELRSTSTSSLRKDPRGEARPWNLPPLPAVIEHPTPSARSTAPNLSEHATTWSSFAESASEGENNTWTSAASKWLHSATVVANTSTLLPLPDVPFAELKVPSSCFWKTSAAPFGDGKMSVPAPDTFVGRSRCWVPAGTFGPCFWGQKSVALNVPGQTLFVVWEPCTRQPQKLLIAEIHKLNKIKHPNLCTIQDFDVFSSKVYIYTDYATDGTIMDRLQHVGPFSENQCALVITQVLSGLAFLHERDIVHGALKGSNVGLLRDAVELMDWGWSARYERTEKAQTWQRANFRFLAPEIVQSAAPSCASDVWSVGCLLLEMLTNDSPWSQKDFPSDTAEALKYVGMSDATPRIPVGISLDATDFLRQCLQRSPNRRWTSRDLLSHPFVRGNHTQSSIPEDAEHKSKTVVWRSLKIM